MGDTVFVNGRAVVHRGSAGKSIAFPDVCLCPPTPPAGPIPTPLPNTVQARDLDGAASTVLTEGNPTGKQTSFFAKSTGNEVSQPTGGGVVTHGVQGKAYFQSYSPDVMIEGEPVVRHLDLLTHNHVGPAPGNTPPVPWLSTQSLPAMPPPALRIKPSDGPGLSIKVQTASGEVAEERAPVDVIEAGGQPTATKMKDGKLEYKTPKGPVVFGFRELRRAFWTKLSAAASEKVELAVLTDGYPDGTKVSFDIQVGGHAEHIPQKTLSATVKDGKARVTWMYEQPLRGRASASFAFIARIDDKVAIAPALHILAYPANDLRGIKQRLRALGYDAGPPDVSTGGPLDGALKKFQSDNEPLAVSGTLDAPTRNHILLLTQRGI